MRIKREFELAEAQADDAEAVAKYIYLTDEFIYPTLVPSFDTKEWIDFLYASLNNEKHLFCAKNITVAKYEGRTVGICCAFPCAFEFRFLENVPSAYAADFEEANRGYFQPLAEENQALDGICVSNLCVDSDFRGKGIGKALLNEVVRKNPDCDIWLDVLANNTQALRLYRACGFTERGAYRGYGGKTGACVECLHLCRPKEKER